MTRIKLCGLQRPEEILMANELKVDAVGFVFYEKSKRFLSMEQAKELKRSLSSKITAIGVFVNAELSEIEELLSLEIIDAIQLHGREDDSYISSLRNITDLPILKAVQVGGKKDIEKAKEYDADYLLLDAGMGDGKTFDWKILQDMKDMNTPYFLAGGLNEKNVKEAIKHFCPFGVDVSSGIETDGKKDFKKMKEFVQAVRSVKDSEVAHGE